MYNVFTATWMLLAASAFARADDGRSSIAFNRDIRPLLTDNCFACHGPDSAGRQADLRLDHRESAIESGAVIPGSSDESEMIARVMSRDPDFMMPPPDSHKKLEPHQQELLRDWIDAGAQWEEHWAFIMPRKAPLPQPPGIDDWANNPIDHFVMEKLHELGLQPNRPADRYTLARRAALDLTGLPPVPALVEELIEGSRDSYSRYIDSLLALPQAGEHRARFWLDAARYGDTHGMHVDNYREIWPYRDWVIGAFNANMPFDQFVVEQLAGDLLPRPTLDQRIATGFSRCNITTSEGGAILEELNVRYMVDRVETTATVFLGLTAGCAVCHDHKYDPISQNEFYQLGAFFNNTTQPAMDGNQRDTPPVVTLPKTEFEDEWEQLMEECQSLRRELRQWKSGAANAWAIREREHEHVIGSDNLALWMPLTKGADDSMVLPEGAHWATDHPAGRRGIRYGGDSELSIEFPTLRSDAPLTVSFWFRTPDRVVGTTLFNQTVTTTKDKTVDGESVKSEETVGWKIESGVQNSLTFELFDDSGEHIKALLPDNEALTPRSWQHVCVRYSGGQSQSSVTISVNGTAVSLRHGTDALVNGAPLASAPLKIASHLPTAGLSDIRIYRRWINDQEVQLLAEDHLVRSLLDSDDAWDELDARQQARFGRYYDEVIDENYRERAAKLSDTQRRRDFIYARSTTSLVMQDRESAPRAWVLQRGEYDQRRDEVGPDVPRVLPPIGENDPRNRLGLARWLVRPGHPLTARVTVNRLWQSVFGVGLVRTSEDFGVMGDRPSHPELLDWLAVEFVEKGWDVQHILKLITTSAMYQQSGTVTADQLAADPDNRLFTRGSRIRLAAEVLRDQALSVSGLLRDDVGGPSVRPYQPAGLWKVVAIVGSNTNHFKQDSGDGLYRRSLYTFWKRTSPPPSMAAFNAPTREQCTVRRERTNTPLQALVLMNDPQFVEAARHLAERALQRHEDDGARAAWIFSTVLSRPANEAGADVAELLAAAGEFRDIFQHDADSARALVRTGDSVPDVSLDETELAAWTMVANILMNRDDFVSK